LYAFKPVLQTNHRKLGGSANLATEKQFPGVRLHRPGASPELPTEEERSKKASGFEEWAATIQRYM
jgi:hypothetical protein